MRTAERLKYPFNLSPDEIDVLRDALETAAIEYQRCISDYREDEERISDFDWLRRRHVAICNLLQRLPVETVKITYSEDSQR